MKIIFSIMLKFLLTYFGLISMAYAIILILFVQIHQVMKVSNNIVDKKYAISSLSKRMIENLLSMEENEKKYKILKKKEYWDYFVVSQKEFEANLKEVLKLAPKTKASPPWHDLYLDYQRKFPTHETGSLFSPGKIGALNQGAWIPEEVINAWIDQISQARSKNEAEVESDMWRLHHRGRAAIRWGMAGLGILLLVGLLGSLFLTHSIHRPLRELRKGIGSISRDGLSEPIQILSRDEFGELAQTFNKMTARLKEAERMRSDFISMLSHEIRTPLTSIRESVNLISEELMGPVSNEQRRFLDIAGKELIRISDLLNHLMQVSRMEAGALEINPRALDPLDYVEESICCLSPLAESRYIRVNRQISPEIPQVWADPEHLRQVLINLIGNAIKFSPSGEEVVVGVGVDLDKHRVAFSIADRGPGIPEEELPHVFHKYYRVSGMRNQADGVGLGLSISKYILEAHGGDIWVKSHKGQGSTFGFTLPVAIKENTP
jgi:signal transduction histidine kinase